MSGTSKGRKPSSHEGQGAGGGLDSNSNKGSLSSTPSKYGKIAKPRGDNRKNAEGKHLPLSKNRAMLNEVRAMKGMKGACGRFDHTHARNGGGTLNPGHSKYSGPHARQG